MRRGTVVLSVLLATLLLAELATDRYGERVAAEALCGVVDVELASPVLARVLAGRSLPFTAHLDARALELLVPLPDIVRGVEIRGGRLLLETVAGVSVPAEVVLGHGAITVTPTLGIVDLDRLRLRFETADLLPTGIEMGSLEVRGHAVVATGRGDPRAFESAGRSQRCDQLREGSSG